MVKKIVFLSLFFMWADASKKNGAANIDMRDVIRQGARRILNNPELMKALKKSQEKYPDGEWHIRYTAKSKVFAVRATVRHLYAAVVALEQKEKTKSN